MAKAYLYTGVGTSEAPGLLAQKIASEVGVAPTEVQKPNAYLYITFAADLSADEKSALDDFVASRNGTFAGTDAAPISGVVGIGKSPDLSFWKLAMTNLGVAVPTKIV